MIPRIMRSVFFKYATTSVLTSLESNDRLENIGFYEKKIKDAVNAIKMSLTKTIENSGYRLMNTITNIEQRIIDKVDRYINC